MTEVEAPSRTDRILGGLWGSLVGDALGVPVEFKDRAAVQLNPVNGMRGYGTHQQPPGTWSDDGALTLCTVDSLIRSEFDTQDIGQRFVAWLRQGLWTATGEVFDVGLTTRKALMRIEQGMRPEHAGGRDEHDNGNGSLMRILPIALRFAQCSTELLLDRLARCSAITHGHVRSQMACGLYGLVIKELLEGAQPNPAVHTARNAFRAFYDQRPELTAFRRLLEDDLAAIPEELISSTGYVIHTLTAGLWCLLTTTNYNECVLKAVNLGGDTDTTGCVAGSLAGVCYGIQGVPQTWLEALARQEEVAVLFGRFARILEGQV